MSIHFTDANLEQGGTVVSVIFNTHGREIGQRKSYDVSETCPDGIQLPDNNTMADLARFRSGTIYADGIVPVRNFHFA